MKPYALHCSTNFWPMGTALGPSKMMRWYFNDAIKGIPRTLAKLASTRVPSLSSACTKIRTLACNDGKFEVFQLYFESGHIWLPSFYLLWLSPSLIKELVRRSETEDRGNLRHDSSRENKYSLQGLHCHLPVYWYDRDAVNAGSRL